MKRKIQGGIAVLLSLVLVLMNLYPMVTFGDKEVTISPMIINTETEKVYAADPTSAPTPTSVPSRFKFKHSNIDIDPIDGITLQSIGDGYQIVVTGADDSVDVNITSVEWSSLRPEVATVSPITTSPTERNAIIKAINPGYSTIWARVTFDGKIYDVMCQVYVPLAIAPYSDAGNEYDNGPYKKNMNPFFRDVNAIGEWRGMREGGIFTNDPKGLTLQLSYDPDDNYNDIYKGVDVGDKFSHYLVKIENVEYMDNVTSETVVKSETDVVLKNSEALDWISSNPSVCTVNEYGIITATGTGYAEITITTKTIGNKGKPATATLKVLVAPTARLVREYNTQQDKMSNNFRVVAPGREFYIDTNAKDVLNLEWIVYKANDSKKDNIINKPDLMNVDISKNSSVVKFTNVKAGIYVITAVPKRTDRNDAAYENMAGRVGCLKITVIVPIDINKNEICMNVGDTYDILNNSNIPNKNVFKFTVANGGNNIISCPTTIITALSQGKTEVWMNYLTDSTNIYEGLTPALTPEEKKEIERYSGFNYEDTDIPIPVRVIDGISLSTTSAIIYVGHEFQLNVNTSNKYASVKWTSSDASIATVNEDGVVKGVKPGDAVITATQVINGVTKTAKCEIRVLQTITEITINPSNANIAIGDYLTLNATIKPNSTGASLYWVSSDTSVINIAEAGKLSATVQAVKGGIAVVSAINQDNVVVGSCLIKVHEPITGITLSETKISLSIADKWFQLYATIVPAAAADREVIWKSTDESIIKVDNHGRVTLVKSGNAAIVATSKDNASIMAICNVTVTSSVTGIKLDTSRKDMYVGETFRLSYVISPSDASNSVITWSSTNATVATVDNSGLISAKAVGSTTIIAKTNEGGYMAMCTVNVSRTATAVKLDVTKLTLNVGDSYLFQTIITPADATETLLSWESSDTSVAVISKTGKVTAKKAGTCVILVKTKSGSTAYCSVTVYQGSTGIKISSSEETIYVGETLELQAEIIPATATNQNITWSSNNPTVAYVNNKGEVKGLQGGVAIITCKAVDGGYIDTCIVTVEELVTDIELNETAYRIGVGKTFKLQATISGATATNKQVSFRSSNNSVVTVDRNGVIRGVKIGKATITCYAEDGSGAEAYCEVEVVRLVTEISLNESYITLVQGKSFTLKATVTPGNATFNTPVWTSNNTEIAIVNNKGVITALKPGECIITAAADDSSKVTSLCYVRVIAPVASSGVTPQETEVIMSPGETKTVGISIVPTNSTDTYTWSSDNTAVATVNEKTGKITAVALGTANITIMTESGRKATIKVYVVGLSRTYVELQQYTNLLLRLEVDGTSTAGLKVRWDVDNQEIATVVNGSVTARAIGTTTVYAVVNGRRLACTIKVVKIK